MSQSSLQRFIDQTLAPFESAILALSDNRILHIKSTTPSDHGTLPAAIDITQKFLPVNEGDIVILNDPYSGSSTLNYLTFVTCLRNKKANEPGLILAVRKKMTDNFNHSESIEHDGVRIPPTPIQQNGQTNSVILQAISSHPLCAKDFSTIFEKTKIEIQQTLKKVQGLSQQQPQLLRLSELEKRIQQSRQNVLNRIMEFPYGESRAEVMLDSGEILKLRLEVSSKEIKIDFGGSSAGKKIFLTDYATFGACYTAISHHFGFSTHSNSGSHSVLQVIKPSGCFLNAKYPQPVTRGFHSATEAILTACEIALLKLHPKSNRAQTQFQTLRIQFDFANKNTCFLNLPSGTGAQANCDGVNSIFTNSDDFNFSIQEIEKKFPLRIIKIEPRTSLGGKGKFNGGRGLTFQLQVLEDCQIKLSAEQMQKSLKPLKNKSSLDMIEVEISEADQIKNLPLSGSTQLSQGTIVTLFTGTGAGLIN